MTATRTIRITAIAALAASTMTFAGALLAAPSPQAAIAARQAGFKTMGASMKALNDQLKSDAPAGPAMVAAARTIAATAAEQGKLFPVGSGPAAGVKTDALPAIWTDRATFDAQMAMLVAQSTKLAAIAGGGDVAAIRVQAKATGAVCGACHRQFRSDS